MNIAEKFGRWFVVGVWILAGGYCLLNVYYGAGFGRLLGFKVFNTQDAIFALAGCAFFVAAFGIARHHRWARPLFAGALGAVWLLGSRRAANIFRRNLVSHRRICTFCRHASVAAFVRVS